MLTRARQRALQADLWTMCSPFFHQSSHDRPSSGADTQGVAMAIRASRCWSANCTLVMSIGAAKHTKRRIKNDMLVMSIGAAWHDNTGADALPVKPSLLGKQPASVLNPRRNIWWSCSILVD